MIETTHYRYHAMLRVGYYRPGEPDPLVLHADAIAAFASNEAARFREAERLDLAAWSVRWSARYDVSIGPLVLLTLDFTRRLTGPS